MILDQRNTVCFDLDGTLLPFRQDMFIHAYFSRLAKRAIPYGFDADGIMKAVWAGTAAMMKNDGTVSNETAFWTVFEQLTGGHKAELEGVFREFYCQEFDEVQEILTARPDHRELLGALRERECGIVLATNPLFPPEAIRTRLSWVGLTPEDFDYITTYDNSRFCKPNPAYFPDILELIGRDGSECVMVGNNLIEDGSAAQVGMKVFLVTDHLEDGNKGDVNAFHHGPLSALQAWLLS